mmetsp:Transcript_29708/g.78857  ORF Transcript_29708/g.78857 Transcript_29708/m.78857 type:complete len:266 (+) Transcript_29708:673-1470(+)
MVTPVRLVPSRMLLPTLHCDFIAPTDVRRPCGGVHDLHNVHCDERRWHCALPVSGSNIRARRIFQHVIDHAQHCPVTEFRLCDEFLLQVLTHEHPLHVPTIRKMMLGMEPPQCLVVRRAARLPSTICILHFHQGCGQLRGSATIHGGGQRFDARVLLGSEKPRRSATPMLASQQLNHLVLTTVGEQIKRSASRSPHLLLACDLQGEGRLKHFHSQLGGAAVVRHDGTWQGLEEEQLLHLSHRTPIIVQYSLDGKDCVTDLTLLLW